MLDESNKPTRRDKLEPSSSDRERLKQISETCKTDWLDPGTADEELLQLAFSLDRDNYPYARGGDPSIRVLMAGNNLKLPDIEAADQETLRRILRLVLHLAEQAIDQQAERIQQLELAWALKTYKRPRGRPRKVLLKREGPPRSPGRPQRFPWLLPEVEKYKSKLRDEGDPATNIAAVKRLMTDLKVERPNGWRKRREWDELARKLAKLVSERRNS